MDKLIVGLIAAAVALPFKLILSASSNPFWRLPSSFPGLLCRLLTLINNLPTLVVLHVEPTPQLNVSPLRIALL